MADDLPSRLALLDGLLGALSTHANDLARSIATTRAAIEELKADADAGLWIQNQKPAKDNKDQKDFKDVKDTKDQKDAKDEKDSKDYLDQKEAKDFKDKEQEGIAAPSSPLGESLFTGPPSAGRSFIQPEERPTIGERALESAQRSDSNHQ